MQQINVSLISDNENLEPLGFEVEILGENNTKTAHHVTLSQRYYQQITGGLKSPEELVRSSFEFLLERESKESILSRFDLTEIGRYFPEFEKLISTQFKK